MCGAWRLMKGGNTIYVFERDASSDRYGGMVNLVQLLVNPLTMMCLFHVEKTTACVPVHCSQPH